MLDTIYLGFNKRYADL